MTEIFSGYHKSTHELIFRVYASGIPDSGKRQTHRLAHFAALDLLGAALEKDFGVRHAVIRRSGLEKPELIHDFLHMNLSHCRGLAVAAVGKIPLGVDAEAPRIINAALMQKVCAPEELSQIQAAADPERMFLRLWTLKEAYAKYTGEGIRLGFSGLPFSFAPDGQILFHHPDAGKLTFMQHTDISGCTVSLCLQGGADLILKEHT